MYYAQRNNLLNDHNIHIDLDELREYFFKIYKYFNNKKCFEVAFNGAYEEDDYGRMKQVKSPLLKPSPDIFFLNHLNSMEIYPIDECYQWYTEKDLFTIIEILYDNIGYYDFENSKFITEEPKEEFLEHINNILKLYSDGYMLEKSNGFIMKIPNQAISELLREDVSCINDDGIIEQMKSATEKYYRFGSTLDDKKGAIKILADILEPLREELKKIFGTDLGVNKNIHDKLIFEIVNKFNIRHNDISQNKEYKKDVWYDWMMQYYTSVILTYYKLKISYNE